MSGVFVRLDWLTGLKIAIGGALILWSNSTLAQVTPDTTLGAESSVVTPNVEIRGVVSDRIDGGAIRGANLFHSFQEFNVREGRGVYFSNPQGIENILSRVTGANRSEILGKLGVLGNANLFLINPSGIVFGQNASLDVEGSFVATTARSFKFSNGTEFSATNPQAPPLLTMSITPGLQYGSSQLGSAIESVGNLASKQDLTLVADNLELSGQLSSGRNLSIGSVSSGLAQINSPNTPILSVLGDVDVAANYTGASLLVEALGNIRFGGKIDITQLATRLPNGLDTQTLSNSSALILRSGQNALVYADNTLGNAPASGGLDVPKGITLSRDVVLLSGVGGTVNLEAGKGDITTQLISTNGGTITLNAANGSILTSNLLSYSDLGTVGNGGAITLIAGANINTRSLISNSISGTAGNGGAITLGAGENINTGDLISFSISFAGTAGNGGAITLSAGANINTEDIFSFSGSSPGTANERAVTFGGAITLSARANINTEDLSSFSSSLSGTANGGAIALSAGANINTEDLSSFSSSLSGTANGGAIALSAGANINTEKIWSYSNSPLGIAGNGGAIALSAGDTIKFQGFDLLNETYFPNSVSINSSGATGSGNITINSNAPFVLDNGTISSDTFGSGKAGDIQITSPSISLTNGAQLSASTHSTGTGGNITLVATDEVELSGETTKTPRDIFVQKDSSNIIGRPPDTPSVIYLGGYIPNGTTFQPPSGTVFPSGVFSQTTVGSTGRAGDLKIETGRLIVNNGAAIATTTFGQNSNAGNISIQAKDSISIANGSILSGVAGGAKGDSGTIELQTRSLSITQGGIVQTQTLGEGNAGLIQVNATEAINLFGNGSALRSGSGGSNILLGTASSKIGQGGDINVTTNKLTLANEAVLDATTRTNSKGGDIRVNANTLTLKNGRISALTEGLGDAGSINLNVTGLLSATDSNIITSATQSNGGAIKIKAGDIRLYGDSDITTNVGTGTGGGGDIMLTANSIIAFDDSDILAFARDGKGGNINLNTRAFFGQNYQRASSGLVSDTLDGNNRVDINASGAISSGVVTLPDTSFIQESLSELPENVIDTGSLIANSCIARGSRQLEGRFTITGSGGLPDRPGEALMSQYTFGTARTVSNTVPFANSTRRPWQKGDPIVEPQGVYRLSSGQLVLSRECL